MKHFPVCDYEIVDVFNFKNVKSSASCVHSLWEPCRSESCLLGRKIWCYWWIWSLWQIRHHLRTNTCRSWMGATRISRIISNELRVMIELSPHCLPPEKRLLHVRTDKRRPLETRTIRNKTRYSNATFSQIVL